MDRIINNESVVICSVLDALNMDVNETSKLYLFAVMTTDRAIRGRIKSYTNYEVFAKMESAYYQALNRKFVEFQPIFLNAMTMLLLGGASKSEDGQKADENHYALTPEGLMMVMDGLDNEGGVMADVRDAVTHLDELAAAKDVKTLYKDLKIVL